MTANPMVDVRIAAVMNRVVRHFSFRSGATMGNANATCFKDDSAAVSLRGRVSGFAQNITAGPLMSAGEARHRIGHRRSCHSIEGRTTRLRRSGQTTSEVNRVLSHRMIGLRYYPRNPMFQL